MININVYIYAQHIRAYERAYVHIYIHIYVRKIISTCAHTYNNTHIYTFNITTSTLLQEKEAVPELLQIHTYIHYINTYVHYIKTYVHTYIHKYIPYRTHEQDCAYSLTHIWHIDHSLCSSHSGIVRLCSASCHSCYT